MHKEIEMKALKPTRDPDKCTAASLRAFGVRMRRLPFWGAELTCNTCGDTWIPHRVGSVFAYQRIVKLGNRFSYGFWLCGNGCNAR